MALPITITLAGFLALLLIVISSRVIGARQSSSVASGDGGDELLVRRMRGQANFTEYVPITLVLFALIEYQGISFVLLSVLAVAFAFARTIHGYAFAFTDHWKFGRLYGTIITFTVILVLAAIALWMGLSVLLT